MKTRRTSIVLATAILGVSSFVGVLTHASEREDASSVSGHANNEMPPIRSSAVGLCVPGGASWLAWKADSDVYCAFNGLYDCQHTCGNGSWFYASGNYRYRCACYCCPY